MANPLDNRYMTQGQAAVADIDVGLRQYMLKVYNFMSIGLVVTGLVAYFTASSPELLRPYKKWAGRPSPTKRSPAAELHRTGP